MQTHVAASKNVKCCVFCGKSPPEIKLTREHVLRKAIAKILPYEPGINLLQSSFDRVTARQKRTTKFLPQTNYNLTVNDVCKNCNEGWLNVKIELAVEKYLFALIVGTEIDLPKPASDLLALWAAKTAAVRGLMDSRPLAVPPEHFAWIKNNLTPPPFTYVWIGRCEFTPEGWTRHRRLAAEHNKNVDFVHMTTLAIGHVVFYVLGCGGKMGLEMCAETIANLDWHPIFQIWPASNATHFNKLPAFSLEKILELSATNIQGKSPSIEVLQYYKDK